MLKSILLSVILGFSLLLFPYLGKAQKKSKPKSYKVIIRQKDKKRVIGYLLELNKDSIYLIRKPYKSHINISGLKKVSTENIETIKLKRKNESFKGALIGAGVGFATGLVVFALEDRSSIGPPYASQVFMLPLIVLGMIPGAIIGSITSNKRILSKEGLPAYLDSINQFKIYSLKTQLSLSDKMIYQLVK